MSTYTLWCEQHADVAPDVWAPVTPSDRPKRYSAYKRAMHLARRGQFIDHLADLKSAREKLAYWKKRDPSSSTVRLCRDAFYDRLADLRELAGPKLPSIDVPRSYRRAA